jgi:NIMA (never in mitosis gene a)-related kinase 2
VTKHGSESSTDTTTTTAMAAFLDQYEPMDVIGNGSFGIIRKVKRTADGVIFARKELNFERMSEHDRKQIVAEVYVVNDTLLGMYCSY